MDDYVKIGAEMTLRQAAEFGEAQAERRANDLDMRLQVALLENQELRSHIAELEAQLRHEEKRRAELDSENASLSTESDQVWLRATAAEDRVKELEAQLSRGVFVREMSDEELRKIYQEAFCDGDDHDLMSSLQKKAIRACIAAATKLPEGAARVTIGGLAVEYGAGIDLQEVLEDEMLDEGCRYAAHIVFVPEVTGA